MRKYQFLIVDIAIVALATMLAFAVRHFSIQPFSVQKDIYLYVTISVFCVGACIVFSGLHRAVWRYFSFSDAALLIGVVSLSILLAWFLTFTISRAESVPRSVPFLQWVLTIGLMGSARAVARATRPSIRPRHIEPSRHREHVIVVGFNHITELYLRCVSQLASDRISVVGILHEDSTMHDRSLSFTKVIEHPKNIDRVLKKYRVHGVEIDRIVVTESFDTLAKESRQKLLDAEKDAELTLDLFEERLGFGVKHKITQSESNQSKQVRPAHNDNLNTYTNEIKLGYRVAKRIFDFVGALSLLILLSPLIFLTAFSVALDVGTPLTFWQVRPGRFGVPFKVLKFRTMRSAHDDKGRRIPDEKRTSKIGRMLRRIRFDEFPQLLNILKGDMSFVGPRPLLPIDQPDQFELRLSARPGLTGWAQINGGHSFLSKDDKGALDIWYVRHGSLWLDIQILFRTALFIVKGERPPPVETVEAARSELRLLSRRKAEDVSENQLTAAGSTQMASGAQVVA